MKFSVLCAFGLAALVSANPLLAARADPDSAPDSTGEKGSGSAPDSTGGNGSGSAPDSTGGKGSGSAPSWGSACKADSDCSFPNGRCAIPFSNGKDETSVMEDTIIRIGNGECTPQGCNCGITPSQYLEACRELVTRLYSPNFVVTNACAKNGLTCDVYCSGGGPDCQGRPTTPETATHACG
ncbi:hypothetical protein BST61_g9585 [Cercospora zeina]